MSASGFAPSVERCAVGYDAREHSDRQQPAKVLDSARFEADGGPWSSVADLARWVALHLGHGGEGVVSEAARPALLRPWALS
jgi:hypothetical protein